MDDSIKELKLEYEILEQRFRDMSIKVERADLTPAERMSADRSLERMKDMLEEQRQFFRSKVARR